MDSIAAEIGGLVHQHGLPMLSILLVEVVVPTLITALVLAATESEWGEVTNTLISDAPVASGIAVFATIVQLAATWLTFSVAFVALTSAAVLTIAVEKGWVARAKALRLGVTFQAAAYLLSAAVYFASI